MEKLKQILPMPSVVNWIRSFLSDRSQLIVNKESGVVKRFYCSNGVPQGSVLGGLFFAILVNDLAVQSSFHLKFVDDLTISRQIVNNDFNSLQMEMVKFEEQTNSINMPLNPKKCCLIVHSFLRNRPHPVISINGHVIEERSCVMILGLLIQSDLKWNAQVDHMIKKANSSFFMLYKLKRLGAPCKVIKIVYILFVRSILEYGAPIWGPALTGYQIKSIELIQKRALKIILGKEYVNYNSALLKMNLQSLEDRRSLLSLKFIKQFFNQFPSYLPPTHGSISGLNTRNALRMLVPRARTERFKTSPLIYGVGLLNALT